MKTIQEFIAWCEQHKDKRFWQQVDDEQLSPADWDKLVCWRDAIRDNTDIKAEFYTIADILKQYKQACALFSQAEFDQDLTQYFNDNTP